MTPQERKLIDDLAGKLAQTQLGQKDPEAENLIRQEIGGVPDSLYMLVQTVLVQNLALDQAKAQIADLQQRVAAAEAHPAAPTSFLGSLFGGSHSNPPPPPAPAPAARGWQPGSPAPAGAPQGYGAPQAPPPGYGAPPPGYAPPPPGAAPGGGSSFLRSAATTAAGVAAGALAFEGISSLMHGGLGGGGGFGSGGFGHQSGSGFMGSPGETVVNNYYDSPQDNNSDTGDRADNLVASDDTAQDDQDGGTDYQDTSADDSTYDDSGADDGPDGGGGDDSLI